MFEAWGRGRLRLFLPNDPSLPFSCPFPPGAAAWPSPARHSAGEYSSVAASGTGPRR